MVRMVFGYIVIFWIDHRGNRGGTKVLRQQQKKTGKCGNFEEEKKGEGLPKSHFFCNLTK